MIIPGLDSKSETRGGPPSSSSPVRATAAAMQLTRSDLFTYSDHDELIGTHRDRPRGGLMQRAATARAPPSQRTMVVRLLVAGTRVGVDGRARACAAWKHAMIRYTDELVLH